MKKRFLLLAAGVLLAPAPPKPDGLFRNFQHPPLEARPIGLWDWTNGNFSLSQITHELEEAKAKGMGGFDIWDVGTFVDERQVTPAGPPFLGDESLQGIGHAVREAERIGLRLGLVTASSWNSGGAWVQPRHGAMGLYRAVLPLTGPQAFSGPLPFPQLPAGGDLLIERRPDGRPTYFKDVAVLAVPAGDSTLAAGQVQVLTARTDADGTLTWQVPPGAWRVVRYVCAPTGQPLSVPSPRSVGRVIDHFSAEATDAHTNHILDRLHAELGPLRNRSLKYLYADSYEVNTAVWTPRLIEEFRQRIGYDPVPYLPVLDGLTVGGADVSGRFRHDYRKLLSELIITNHYARSTALCRQHGLGFIAEAGGPGPPVHNVPFEDLKALGALTVPRGEFWNRHSDADKLQVVKGIASAAHLYNQTFVEAEAFTSIYVWQEGPQELKPLADRAFCEGLNRIVYHTFPHTPAEAGSPGWVYNFGTLIHVNSSWWPQSRAFHDYLARCGYLLQQGNFVGDVAFYYGDAAPNFVAPKHVPATLGQGYDYDVVNTESILKFMSVRNGKIYLPHGQHYEVLSLPPGDRINLAVLRKLEQLVLAGATVVGRKPARTYGLHDHDMLEREIKTIAARVWGPCDSVRVQQHAYGKGRVVWGKTVRQVLAERGAGPDFAVRPLDDSVRLDYIHRRTATDDIYFVRNTRNVSAEAEVTFRTGGKTPHLWHPATGAATRPALVRTDARTTTLRLALAAHESVFVVFRPGSVPPATVPAGTPATVRALAGPWEVRFPQGWGTPGRTSFPELISWTASPDTSIRHFSGVAAYHASFDLSATEIVMGGRLHLDLGRVRETAEVWLNGRHLGVRCFAPFHYDITPYVRPGANRLVVEVANVLNNRLVGDARLPEPYRRTHSNLTKGPHPWMTPWAQVPLVESGLLGPVVVQAAR